MLKNFLLAGFFLTTVYFGLDAYHAKEKVACLESELCAERSKVSQQAGLVEPKTDEAISANKKSAESTQDEQNESPQPQSVNSSQEAGGSKEAQSKSQEIPAEVVDWRLKSVEKFVDLSEAQREQLRELFGGRNTDPLAQGASDKKVTLKDVLGEDNYAVYQDARARAKIKIESENREKDILYKARIINLTPKEESILRDVTLKVDQDIEARKQADDTKPATPYEGLARYLQYEKLRRELIAAELKSELPTDKYEAYLKVDADSAASEMGVWHGE
jgi:hypothetical protein